jgi:hypothetical protein
MASHALFPAYLVKILVKCFNWPTVNFGMVTASETQKLCMW